MSKMILDNLTSEDDSQMRKKCKVRWFFFSFLNTLHLFSLGYHLLKLN